MNSINKQALALDLSKIKLKDYEDFYDINVLKIERVNDEMDNFFIITYAWGDFSINEIIHIDDTNIKQLIIEDVLNE